MAENENDLSEAETDSSDTDETDVSNPEQSDDDILATAKSRWNIAVDAETTSRALALDDLNFRAGDQWDPKVKAAREQDRRPCLTINRLPQYIRQITNDQRQNRPSIKVDPVDDKADVETAKVYQGLIRHIEYHSNADVAYDTAFEAAATKGLGYYRIITEFCDPMSFEQEIRIKRIRNSFSVYLDPTYQEPDASDADWGFVFEDISKADFKKLYPKAELANMDAWRSTGDTAEGWVSKETIRIAEYFYKVLEETEICQLSTGETVEINQLNKIGLPEGVAVVAKRKTIVPKIKWLKINGVEILERTDWPGRWIPIIPVLGDELDIDGKRVLEGVIRHAKDPQRMYNVWASAETEAIGLAPKAPFIGAAGQFEGHESKWRDANQKSYAYLEYNPVNINGVNVPPPQRQAFEPAVMAITQARQMSAEDLKATTGIYDSALGMKTNEVSGRAIQRRAQQAQTNNYHFIDNLTRALRHGGRILIDLIPHVYDTARTVRIMNEDGSVDMVKVNEVFEHKGKQVNYQLNHGKYDVTVSTGPSFATKRQEAVESMLSLTQSFPKVAEVAADLMVKNMDWPGAQEISDRLKKTLPPGLADDPESKKQPIPPEVQAQMQQQTQLIEQLTEEVKVNSELVNTKRMELESKERIEMAKLQVQLEIKAAEMGSKEALAMLHSEIAQIEGRLNHLQYNVPIGEPEQQQPEQIQQEMPQPQQQPPQQFENQSFENAAPDGAGPQPTGGFPPGNNSWE